MNVPDGTNFSEYPTNRYLLMALWRNFRRDTSSFFSSAVRVSAISFLAVTAFGALAVSAVTPHSSSNIVVESTPSTLAQQHTIYKTCPVANCSQYPSPSGIKAIALSSLENWVTFLRAAESQIRAVSNNRCPSFRRRHKQAETWNGNAIRLQLLQDKMVGPHGNLWSPGYFRTASSIINYALSRCLTVIVNAQTEPATGWSENEQGPTIATYAFWKHFTDSYGHNPHVIFDLFNEPRCQGKSTKGYASAICDWAQWYRAFYPLTKYIRQIGSENQIWIEGIKWGSQLGGVPVITCHSQSWCQGIVYSFHKPGCPWPNKCAVTKKVWWKEFGYLALAHIPVVNGEMTNYDGGYYWSHSTQKMTEYLKYLHQLGIGEVAWSLQPGIMIATTDLTLPIREPQGAGQIFWNYYHGELK